MYKFDMISFMSFSDFFNSFFFKWCQISLLSWQDDAITFLRLAWLMIQESICPSPFLAHLLFSVYLSRTDHIFMVDCSLLTIFPCWLATCQPPLATHISMIDYLLYQLSSADHISIVDCLITCQLPLADNISMVHHRDDYQALNILTNLRHQ